jgi:hypothetical protein
MYIKENAATTYNLELNEDEYKLLSKVFGKLIFNPAGVSNAFRFENEEIQVVKNISGQLYVYNRQNSVY